MRALIERLLKRWEDPDLIFSSPPTIPLSRAWLCEECHTIMEGTDHGKCWRCPSRAIMPFAKYVARVKQADPYLTADTCPKIARAYVTPAVNVAAFLTEFRVPDDCPKFSRKEKK
mgnify:CR=1 FL=1